MVKTKKYNEVRRRYGSMRVDTFEKFYTRDWTDTKKYFEYMVKMWHGNRNARGFYYDVSINDFVRVVKEFDKLLPYMKEKDIYNVKYSKYGALLDAIEDAKVTKLEKTFKKEDHVDVVYECDDFFMVYPKTHTGSLKYGASTKWCTASKRNTWTFESYAKKGTLIYVIDKKGNKGKNYEKLALYIHNAEGGIFKGCYVYNTTDNSVSDIALTNNGWGFDELMLIDIHARTYHFKLRRVEESKKYVNSIMKRLEGIDFERLNREMLFLKSKNVDNKFTETKIVVDKFVKEIKDFTFKE